VSQVKSNENFILGLFYSNPVADYGSTDIENGSFAKPGFGIMFEQKVQSEVFPEGLSLGIHFSNHVNDLDINSLTREFEKVLNNQFAVDIYDYDGFNPLVITAGPFYQYFLTHELSVEIKSGLGVMFANINSVVINVFDNGGNEVLSEVLRFSGDAVFTYMIGTNIGLSLTRNFRLLMFAEYQNASTKIKTTYDTLPSSTDEFDISYINFGVGFSWNLF